MARSLAEPRLADQVLGRVPYNFSPAILRYKNQQTFTAFLCAITAESTLMALCSSSML